MQRYVLLIGAVLTTWGASYCTAPAQETFLQKPAVCEPGYQWVAETIYRDVEHPVCKVVPNMRKKWVYCSKPDYFCVPALHGPCGDCGACKGPYCRQLLLKKQVEYQCGTKCVVEMVKEKAPCIVWKKAPRPPRRRAAQRRGASIAA